MPPNTHSPRNRNGDKFTALLLMLCAYGLGGGGMMAWLAFVFMGPLFSSAPQTGFLGSVWVDVCLCLAFFGQHSIMARSRFRRRTHRIIHPEFYDALYASLSGVCLLALAIFWQPVGGPLFSPPIWLRWIMSGLFFLAIAVAWWGASSLEKFDSLGVAPAWNMFRARPANTPHPFTVRGPYRWVRHPLYFLGIVIIWSGPVFTLDRLLHNFLWSAWIVVGAHLEDRELIARFGDAYRSYRKTVPMLIPKSIRPRHPSV